MGARNCNQWRLYGTVGDFGSDAAIYINYFLQTCLTHYYVFCDVPTVIAYFVMREHVCSIVQSLYSTDLSVNRWVMNMEKVKVRSGWTTYSAWEQKRALLTVDVQNGRRTTVDIVRMCQSPVKMVRQSAPLMNTMRDTEVECRSLAGELLLSCTRPAADG